MATGTGQALANAPGRPPLSETATQLEHTLCSLRDRLELLLDGPVPSAVEPTLADCGGVAATLEAATSRCQQVSELLDQVESAIGGRIRG